MLYNPWKMSFGEVEDRNEANGLFALDVYWKWNDKLLNLRKSIVEILPMNKNFNIRRRASSIMSRLGIK